MAVNNPVPLAPPKYIHDPVHGLIQLDPVYMTIIDTPEFQRLRNIKQLGGCNYVYPGAVHTRFEHSIGTCHIALQLIQHLKKNEKTHYEITKEEELCVGIAALCHDLGHGPFSHLFDRGVIPKLQEDPVKIVKHEFYSIKIFDRMMDRHESIKRCIESAGYVMKDWHYRCIKEMIYGPYKINEETSRPEKTKEELYKHNGEMKMHEKKRFLYEIVSNEETGIDVDKWDYFARDCYYLGIHNNFDYRRFIMFARVIDYKGVNRICLRDKEEHNVYEMFHTRYRLYRQAYFHKVTTGIEEMIAEAIIKAAPTVKLLTSKEDGTTIKDVIRDLNDLDGYLAMDDHIVTLIRHSTEKGTELKEAQRLLERVTERDIYKCIGKISIPQSVKDDDLTEAAEDIVRGSSVIGVADILCKMRTMAYWKGGTNPVEKKVLFYNKENETKAFLMSESESSEIQPRMYEKHFIYVYVKHMGKVKAAEDAVNVWSTSGKEKWMKEVKEK